MRQRWNRAARKNVGTQRTPTLDSQIDFKYPQNMSEEQAKSIGSDLAGMRLQNEKIRKKYFNQISKTISSTVALRFVLLENYIESMVRFSILDELPFVGDELIHESGLKKM